MDNEQPPRTSRDDITSLERNPTTIVEPTAGGRNDSADTSTPSPETKRQGMLRRFISRFSIYLLLFLLLIVAAGIAGTLLYLRASNSTTTNNTPTSQSLPQSTLNELTNNDVTVGEAKHTLNIQGNTVFSGSVLVRSSLQIAGKLRTGSTLDVSGARITGNTTVDDLQVTKSLALTGNGSIQGQLNVQKTLSVNGGGTFLGALSAPSLTVDALQLNGNLNLTHHIAAGGSTPSRTGGSALGGGGTVSIGGSDTAGSITINTGSSPAAGCFATIAFVTSFNDTPHVTVTPVGSAAGGLNYYVSRSTSNFSICTTNSAPASSTFGFDYMAME